ncbi:MAG: hypothetical protein JWO11_356 [Nocardioides sp.]|nr:hypothetical protein [Nocardioides sp.]
MLILGLLLIVVGALAIVAALFSGGTVQFLSTDVSAMFTFFLGLGAGIAILWGFTIAKFGTKRQLRQHREAKKLTELSEKLERSEHERSIERERDEDRPSL